jgi:arylsulfatase
MRRFIFDARLALTSVALLVLALAGGSASAWAQQQEGGGPASATASAQEERPNIVVIMADDMGFSDLASYGSEIPTPNLDRLAGEGTRFTQFYVTPRCSPTRASLMTGLYSHQAGLGHLSGFEQVQEVFDRPAYQNHLRSRAATLATLLSEQAGYHTLMTGKWHLGYKPGQRPTDRGFDRYYGALGGGLYFWPPLLDRRIVSSGTFVTPDTTAWAEGEGWYATDAFTDKAVQFLEEGRGDERPFFLYLAHIAPHFPLQAFPDDIAAHEGDYMAGWDRLRRRRHERLVKKGLIDSSWALPAASEEPAWEEIEDKEAWDRKMAIYAAQVEAMDQSVGRVLDALDRLGVADNTIVMFLSDNGASAENINRRPDPGAPLGSPGTFVSYGQPWARLSDTPFRGFKKQTYEGGIASPLIVRWPGEVEPGSTTRQVGHVIDLVPTLLEAAGATYPDRLNGRDLFALDGRSLLPALRGRAEEISERTLFWEHEGNRAVRRGRWKLVAPYDAPWALYDMETDRTETNDVAAKHPEKVEVLKQRYEQWAERLGVGDWDRFVEARD